MVDFIASGNTSSTIASSYVVWDSWNRQATSTATSTSTNGDTIWRLWTDTSTTTNTVSFRSYQNTVASNQVIWADWLRPPSPIENFRQRAPVVVSPEEKVRRAAADEKFRKEEEKRKEVRRIAIGKADALLVSILNSVQKEQLQKHDWFLVRSESGKVYRLRKGRSANVDLIDEITGEVLSTLCAHPSLNVPDGDTVAAQKLMLQCEEKEFLRMAIRHTPRGGKVPLNELQYIN